VLALSQLKCGDSPVEACSGHVEIFGYLGGRFAGVDESLGVLDLAGGEELLPAAEVLAGGAAFGHAVGDPFSFDC